MGKTTSIPTTTTNSSHRSSPSFAELRRVHPPTASLPCPPLTSSPHRVTDTVQPDWSIRLKVLLETSRLALVVRRVSSSTLLHTPITSAPGRGGGRAEQTVRNPGRDRTEVSRLSHVHPRKAVRSGTRTLVLGLKNNKHKNREKGKIPHQTPGRICISYILIGEGREP